MEKVLQGQHAFITGGAGGIGLAVAKAYLQAGACCTVTDHVAALNSSVQAELQALSTDWQYLTVDVRDKVQISQAIIKAQQRFSPINILFNNAAIFDMAPLLESSEDMYERIFAVNVKGMFLVMQAVLQQMVDQQIKGSVINMASQAGRRGEALVSHYCASKAAVISYTQSAALAMAPYGIRVNAIAPGVIDTPMWATVDSLFARYEGHAPGVKKQLVGKAVPLGYMGQPDDVAGAALFLASPAAAYITAQTLNVDGGNVMS